MGCSEWKTSIPNQDKYKIQKRPKNKEMYNAKEDTWIHNDVHMSHSKWFAECVSSFPYVFSETPNSTHWFFRNTVIQLTDFLMIVRTQLIDFIMIFRKTLTQLIDFLMIVQTQLNEFLMFFRNTLTQLIDFFMWGGVRFLFFCSSFFFRFLESNT